MDKIKDSVWYIVIFIGFFACIYFTFQIGKEFGKRETDSRVVYFPYMYKDRETFFHDSIIVHEVNKTYIKKEYEKDSIYISSLPDSLLWNVVLTRARELLEQ